MGKIEAQVLKYYPPQEQNVSFLAPNISRIEDYRKPSNIIDARNRFPQRVEDEKALPVPSLAREIDAINLSGDQDIYLLKKTGFQTETQTKLLMQNMEKGQPLERSFQQIEQDIQAFKIEYLVEGPLFPIVLEKVQKDGRTRVAGKLYGDKLWIDSTDVRERDGTIKKSVAEMEEFLVDAEPGSMVVLTSPSGWSGYEGIDYPDSQTYAIEVQKDGGLRGFTIKSDMSLSQNEKLLEKYGALKEQNVDTASDKARIKRLTSSVIKFYPEDKKRIEDVVQDIKHIKNSEVSYRDTLGRTRYFSETMELLAHPEVLWELDSETQELVNNLKEYISYRLLSPNRDLAQDIQVALGYTVLRLMYQIRPPRKASEMRSGAYYVPAQTEIPPFDPRREADEMEKIAGCAGGGVKVNSVTPRAGILGADEHGGLSFKCPECERTNVRERGKILTQCQYADCKSTKVYCDDSKSSSKPKEKPVEESRKQNGNKK